MRPFFRHFGAKWRLATLVPPPLHGVPIIEPFAGSACYATRFGANREVLLIDLSQDVVDLWDYLLGASQEDILKLPVDFGREDIRTLGISPIEERFLQRWITIQGSKSTWRMPPSAIEYVKSHTGSFWSAVVRERISQQLPLIRKWRVKLGSYDDAPDVEATWEIDPPYQLNKHAKAKYGTAPIDYAALGAWCRTRRGLAIVHEQIGADWLPFSTLCESALTGSRQNGAGRQHEVVWINPVPPEQIAMPW